MKKIPQTFIDEVLARVDIVSVVERSLPLKKAGSNYVSLCPFHNEKSPSFTVSPSKQFYYCFGCGASGNAIGFLMEYDRLHFVDALEMLASQAGMSLPTETVSSAADTDYQALLEILAKAEQFYRVQLHRHSEAKKARQYLQEKRGLSEETIKHFGLGYAPNSWEDLLRYFSEHDVSAALLMKAGLLSENEQKKQYDRFRDRIMFPIRDRRGRVIGFGGRVLDDSTPKYLNSPETSLFHKGQELYGLYEARQANRDLKQLLVVEGYMDVISLANHGVTFAVATLGTAVTVHHVQRILRSCQAVVFCFDGDLAGRKAAWKALEETLPALNDQASVRFMFMPDKEDPDSFIQQQGQEVFLAKMKEAMPLADFFVQHLSETVNLETLAGRAQLVSAALPYLKKMTAPINQALMFDLLAETSHTSLEQIKTWGREEKSLKNQPVSNRKSSQTQTPVRLAITLLLQHPELGSKLPKGLPQGGLPGLDLLQELLDLLHDHSYISTGGILEYWRNRPEAKYFAQLASSELLIPESGVLAELESILKHIKQLILTQAMDALIVKANTQGLSQQEKEELRGLLSQKKVLN